MRLAQQPQNYLHARTVCNMLWVQREPALWAGLSTLPPDQAVRVVCIVSHLDLECSSSMCSISSCLERHSLSSQLSSSTEVAARPSCGSPAEKSQHNNTLSDGSQVFKLCSCCSTKATAAAAVRTRMACKTPSHDRHRSAQTLASDTRGNRHYDCKFPVCPALFGMTLRQMHESCPAQMQLTSC